MAADWRAYQEEAAEFFRSLGFEAQTDFTIEGARTKHDIDVYVEIDVAGFDVKWLVECKYWQKPVSKLHVLALRTIVTDVGADRGIILCETGFQSGAYDGAELTNVQVTSLAALGASSRSAIAAARLRDLFDRNASCRERYWDIPKAERIAKGLRYDTFDDPVYSGAFVVEVVEHYLTLAFRGQYPITVDKLDHFKADRPMPAVLSGPEDVLNTLEPLISELEAKLIAAES